MIDIGFANLFRQLMKNHFMTAGKPAFGAKPTEAKIRGLLAAGEVYLPEPFRQGYSEPLDHRLDSLFARFSTSQGTDTFDLETLTGAVYQHADTKVRPALNRFLAVISDMYRSFLSKTKRGHLEIDLKETLPPVAVFQSDPSSGPFTITCESIGSLTGGDIGVVSLPHTFAAHPLLFGSLTHETGGHDVIHADLTLLPQLRSQVYSLFTDTETQWLGLLWDYWMDEAAADVYGVLNMGPTFGHNLAMLLAVFIGQMQKPIAKTPQLRVGSGADENGALDPHPTDLLRLALVQGVVDNLTHLSSTTRATYVEQLSRLAEALAPPGTTTIELEGFAQVANGRAMNFERAVPLDVMQEAARQVGAMIALTPFEALAGHTIQDIETWDDADERAAVTIAGRLHAGAVIIGAGDDAQIVAGLTLAALQDPTHYDDLSDLANAALDDSFRKDPFWGTATRDLMVLRPSRTLRDAEVQVDPYAAAVIDYNPLDEGTAGLTSEMAAAVVRHAIAPIPWPDGTAPEIDRSFTFRGPDAELPRSDFVLITWTSAEANAMAAVLTPGIWAMPPSHFTGKSWYTYTNQWNSKFRGRSTGRSPAAEDHYIGKYMPIRIGGRSVLLFKSNFHLARDDKSMPVKDMFKQVILQTGAHLVITTGTAGAIGSKLKLGDAVVANTALFKCDGTFKNAPFNKKKYSSGYAISHNGHLKIVNSKLIGPNAAQLKPERTGHPEVFTTAAPLGEPDIIVTTDKFEFDDKGNTFGLQKLGAMVEMDDAVLGLACEEMGGPTKWLAIRNASDPQMPTDSPQESSAIYNKYGFWTSITSVLACWAMVLDA